MGILEKVAPALRLGWAGLLVGLLALQPARAAEPIPLIRMNGLQDVQETAEGMTRPIMAVRNGHRYIFKANAPFTFNGVLTCAHGNFETELIANALHRLVGVKSPELKVVRIEGKEPLYLRIKFADQSLTKSGGTTSLRQTPIGEDEEIDDVAACKLALVDLLIGNFDRHDKNLLVYKDAATGAWTPLPIDQNLALLTASISEQRDWLLRPYPKAGQPQKAIKDYGDWYLHHFRNNGFFRRALAGPAAHTETVRLARELQQALPDPVLIKIMRSIPREVITVGEPEARLGEILQILQSRRDGLVSFLERYFEAGGCS